MAQLDRLLAVMISNRAEALTLDEGDLAKLELDGGARAVTKSPLTPQQVVGLLKEIAPADAGRLLDAAKPANFSYATTDGAFAVRAAVTAGKWRVRIVLEGVEPTASEKYDPLSAFQPAPPMMTPIDVPSMRPTPAASGPALGRPGAPPKPASPNPPPPPPRARAPYHRGASVTTLSRADFAGVRAPARVTASACCVAVRARSSEAQSRRGVRLCRQR